jgi:hypothetical protein
MSTSYAVEVPAPVLADVTEYLRREKQASALLDGDEPLTAEERQVLERSLRWWQLQYETARRQILAITARLV